MNSATDFLPPGVELEPLGPGSWLVHTNEFFDDGDEFHIVLNVTEDGFLLTDEAHTLMWLSFYDDDEEALIRSMEAIADEYGVEFENGRARIPFDSTAGFCPALSSLTDAIYKASALLRSVRLGHIGKR